MFQTYRTEMHFPNIEHELRASCYLLLGNPRGAYSLDETIQRLDLFHPNFDEVYKLVRGVQVIFHGESSKDSLPTSGLYRDPSRFGDAIGEVGFVVPAGYKCLRVTGSNPVFVRNMVSEIRSQSLQLSERWE